MLDGTIHVFIERPGGEVATPVVVVTVCIGEKVTGEGLKGFVFGDALFEELKVVVEGTETGLKMK